MNKTDGSQDNPDSGLFATEVRNCAGQTISLGVFSAKVSLTNLGAVTFMGGVERSRGEGRSQESIHVFF